MKWGTGIWKGDGNTYVECSHFQGCLSLGRILPQNSVAGFQHSLLFSLYLFPPDPVLPKWNILFPTSGLSVFTDWVSFFSLPRALSFYRTARIWHFLAVSFFIYLLFIPHLLPKVALGSLPVLLFLMCISGCWTYTSIRTSTCCKMNRVHSA